ncbi:hypothetical protein CKA32_006320 [Geitlerinema sp. FC II]|nr:hypothetical protein CKA32_006320 [Geitlerinema sp. FC II]
MRDRLKHEAEIDTISTPKHHENLQKNRLREKPVKTSNLDARVRSRQLKSSTRKLQI